MRINVKTGQVRTHEGGLAERTQGPAEELTRTVATCLLWENTFYEKGSDIADRIARLCDDVQDSFIAELAVRARTEMKLRHVPLFLCVQLAKKRSKLTAKTINEVVRRPDEMAELLSLYWKDGKRPISAQIKKGLARAFPKFTPYQLAKWNREDAIKLRDVMFLTHPKPTDPEQTAVWKKLVNKTLEPADTWEAALSSGANKKQTWERFLREKKLGYMALLMNLRNMTEASVDQPLVAEAILSGAKGSKALPFRFVSAAKEAPYWREALSIAMGHAIEGRLPGSTFILIDVSGSMDSPISSRSKVLRWEAAGALGVLAQGMADQSRVFTFSYECVEVTRLRGLQLVEGIGKSQGHGGTYLGKALAALMSLGECDRVIIVTDEQAHDALPEMFQKGYMINVAPYQRGVDTDKGDWTRINGWSERVLDWILFEEHSRVQLT